MNTIAVNKRILINKTITTVLAVVCSIALPQLFHLAGIWTGLGTSFGTTLLPMHIPVLLVGLLAGSAVGVVVGAISPLVSFAITGMPPIVTLPFMMVELATYGFVAGKLSQVNIPTLAKVFIIQVVGRAVRAVAIIVAIYLMGNTSIEISQIWRIIPNGLPGIILQWLLIPALFYGFKGLKKHYE